MSDNQELKEKVQMLSDAHKSLYLFTKDIFAKSFTNFIGGDYVEKSCEELQKYDRTMRLAFRSGFKSTSFYSKIMRDTMFRGIKEDLDIRYFSYKEELAGWHIGNIKSLIDKNPYFTEIVNLKSSAENVAQYTWDKRHMIKIRPAGIVSASRGLKADAIYCFPADTRIDIFNGSKKIKDINIGDIVKTHTGKFKKVTKVYKRRNFEKVYKIKTKYQTFYATKNHPILASTKRKKTGYRSSKLWRDVQRLKIGQFLHYPCFYKNKIVYFSKRKKRKDRLLFGQKTLSIDLVWLFGLYVAEGSISNDSRINFSLGSREVDLINKTSNLLKRFFGKVSFDESNKWETNLIVNSRSLSSSFSRWFGKGAKNKKIPKFIFNADEKKKASFLKGLIEGDGCVQKNSVTFVSASKTLRDNFINLCNSLSISCFGIDKRKNNSPTGKEGVIYRCYINPIDWNKIQTLAENEFEIKSKERIWLKKDKKEYKFVYNLEIEDDNTYIANGFVVHNCDDILSDPANPIHPTIILKINSLFKSVILESLKPGGELHIIGSPLSQADFYFDPAIQKEFHTTFHPAIQKDNDGNEISTWPEFYSLEQIKKKVFVMGEKAFQAEMMMEPYYSTDSYFKREQLRKDVVNSKLNNIRLIEGLNTPNLVIAGLDVGRKKHPSAFEVFEIKDNKAIQIHRKIMKGWKYYSGKKFDPLHPTQVEYCREAIKNFGINYLYYDATRGEFLGAEDSGLLSMHFIPITFVPKMRVQMATDFEKTVLNKQLELLDDEEMLNSICSVTNDLLSIETASGTHGDEFWAIALALIGFSKFGASGTQDKEIRVGSPSLFEGKIPKNW